MNIKALIQAAVAAVLTALSVAAQADLPIQPTSRTWLGRPWEFAYILKIDTPEDYEGWRKLSKKNIAANDFSILHPEAVFPQTVAIETNPKEIQTEDKAIGVMVIEFDPSHDGAVLTPHEWPQKLTAHITDIDTIAIASGNTSEDIHFKMGYWRMARSYYDIVFSPGICALFDIDSNNEGWRYKKGYAANRYSSDGNFGCREWGYYLNNPEYPYIDVTSYGKDKFGKFSYIRPVIGWRQFTDDPKPVIGKHGKVWVCLHDCPNGEAPGIIPNIRLWAARNGWPEPKPPKKLPLFPEPNFKPGEMLD